MTTTRDSRPASLTSASPPTSVFTCRPKKPGWPCVSLMETPAFRRRKLSARRDCRFFGFFFFCPCRQWSFYQWWRPSSCSPSSSWGPESASPSPSSRSPASRSSSPGDTVASLPVNTVFWTSVCLVFGRAISHMMSSLLYPLVTFVLLLVCVAYWGTTAMYPPTALIHMFVCVRSLLHWPLSSNPLCRVCRFSFTRCVQIFGHCWRTPLPSRGRHLQSRMWGNERNSELRSDGKHLNRTNIFLRFFFFCRAITIFFNPNYLLNVKLVNYILIRRLLKIQSLRTWLLPITNIHNSLRQKS